MYQPHLAPVSGSLPLSALVAALPLVTLFVLLGGLRLKAHWAGLASLAVAAVVAVAAYGMPARLTLFSAAEGAAFGLFPIMWILITAVWLYQLTVVSGRFEDLRRAFRLISDDPRIQAVIIAFCFGGLLEALAGFGAPVAITGVMLVALGFSPVRAAVIALIADTAPVAFGAVGIPIITAGSLTKIPYTEIGSYVGRQTPLLAVFVPLVIVALVDGRRGLRQTWPAAAVCGAAFGLAQFVSSNFISVELTDIIASLAGLLALVLFLRLWQPNGGEQARGALPGAAGGARSEQPGPASGGPLGQTGTTPAAAATGTRTRPEGTGLATAERSLSGTRLTMAFLPYLIVIAVFSVATLWSTAKQFLAHTDVKIGWPELDGRLLSVAGKPLTSTVYTLPWLSSPGTLLLICGLIVAAAYRLRPAAALREFTATLGTLRWALLTVASVLALAYVMNQSGQTITIGSWIAGTGAAFAFLSPILGWLGTAVSGSDTSANALFATLQQTAGIRTGLNPVLLVAANTSGGVVGKMISPQNLTVAAAAVGLAGRESDLLRGAVKWSAGLLLALCVLVYLQSTVLAGMLP